MLPEDTLNNQKFTKYLTNYDTDHGHFVKLKADNEAARCYSESGRNRLRRNMQAFQQLGWYQPAGRDVIPFLALVVRFRYFLLMKSSSMIIVKFSN